AGIAGIAARKNAKLVVDSSGEALKKALEEKIFLCKPNLGELASLAGEEELSQERAIETAGQIIAGGKCEIIVISMGAAGAAMVTKNEVKIISAPLVKRKSTVGAGDSMIAGIVLSLSKGMEPHQAVMYGVACGTAATMNPGTELCRREDADRLFDIIRKK
ncbi:MAG: bifunctional hydroxymethylpyrimidine kinase/phosphomethylpyrimidine kinase, partial [Gemmatimonadaceae bacterium]|nr:bifunctional hydroxymethylpyrimidine kinase/phosphomethylpyrimidine kinase [Chitinophagaceae bacterium]